jgi:hypothetical protein
MDMGFIDVLAADEGRTLRNAVGLMFVLPLPEFIFVGFDRIRRRAD